jgi:hypothetical protein
MIKTKTTEEPAPKSEKEPWYWIALSGFAIVCAAVGFVRVAEGGFKGASWVYEALDRGHNSLSYQTSIANLSKRLEAQDNFDIKMTMKLNEMCFEIDKLGTSNVFQHLNIVLLKSQVEDLSKKLARNQDAWDWSGSIIMTNMAVSSNIIQFYRPSDVFIYTNGSWRNTK